LENVHAERGRRENERDGREPRCESTAALSHRTPHRPLRQIPVGVVKEFSMKEIADMCSTGALGRVA
jgi:hypothetical protein